MRRLVRLRGFMSEHEFEYVWTYLEKDLIETNAKVCANCGLVSISGNKSIEKLSCPPWSSTVGGESTNTKRVDEAGEVKLRKDLMEFYEILASTPSEWSIDRICEELEKLIQKREGSVRD